MSSLSLSGATLSFYAPFATHGGTNDGYAKINSRNVATDETSSLISSDKVEGTSVYDRRGEKMGIYPLCNDRQNLRESRLRGDVVRRFSGHWRSLPSATLARADLRYRPRRLCRRSRPEQARRGTDLRHKRDAELERSPLGPAGTRLLRLSLPIGSKKGAPRRRAAPQPASSFNYLIDGPRDGSHRLAAPHDLRRHLRKL